MSAVRVVAPAKLTLSLRIVGVRPDGYHLIDAEMVTLSVHDVLTIDPDGDRLAAVGRYADGVPLDESNLVAGALRLAGCRAGVTIEKAIPHGGGLGGGSADAAAVLRWAGFGTDPESLATAARLGADVPFCLVGGRARVRGIGERIEPLPHLDRTVTLVVPPLRVGTPDAYRAWDELGGPTAPGPNDLEAPALRVVPELATWRDRVGDATGRTPVLAGSGATWFVHGEHTAALGPLRDDGADVFAARTVGESSSTGTGAARSG